MEKIMFNSKIGKFVAIGVAVGAGIVAFKILRNALKKYNRDLKKETAQCDHCNCNCVEKNS